MAKHFNLDNAAQHVQAAWDTAGEDSLAKADRLVRIIREDGITGDNITRVADTVWPDKKQASQRSVFRCYAEAAPRHDEFRKLALAALDANRALAKPNPTVRAGNCYLAAVRLWVAGEKGKDLPEPSKCLPQAREKTPLDAVKATAKVQKFVRAMHDEGWLFTVDASGNIHVNHVPEPAAPKAGGDKAAALAAMFGLSPEKAAAMAAMLTS